MAYLLGMQKDPSSIPNMPSEKGQVMGAEKHFYVKRWTATASWKRQY